jgi:signal transduction histidine kinase
MTLVKFCRSIRARFTGWYLIVLAILLVSFGIGSGLVICRQIVEGHGSSISVESELNVGSTSGIELSAN